MADESSDVLDAWVTGDVLKRLAFIIEPFLSNPEFSLVGPSRILAVNLLHGNLSIGPQIFPRPDNSEPSSEIGQVGVNGDLLSKDLLFLEVGWATISVHCLFFFGQSDLDGSRLEVGVSLSDFFEFQFLG